MLHTYVAFPPLVLDQYQSTTNIFFIIQHNTNHLATAAPVMIAANLPFKLTTYTAKTVDCALPSVLDDIIPQFLTHIHETHDKAVSECREKGRDPQAEGIPEHPSML